MGQTNVERLLLKHGCPPLEPRDTKHQARLLRQLKEGGAELPPVLFNYRVSDFGMDCDGPYTVVVREELGGLKSVTYTDLDVRQKTPVQAKDFITEVLSLQPNRFYWQVHTPYVVTGWATHTMESTQLFRLWSDNLMDVTEVVGQVPEKYVEAMARSLDIEWYEYLG